MRTTKRNVLAEIKRLTEANGIPPGKRLFERETGIREADWYPDLWLRWGDALQEAGYTRNAMVAVVGDDILLQQYALLALRLGRLPIQGELIREAKANPSFPGEKSFRRFGGKLALVRAVGDFAASRDDLAAVAAMCEGQPAKRSATDGLKSDPAAVGYVYLMQHGARREFKIGRTNNAIRREGELGIELPHGAQPIHVIETDDPAGIESYWHRRFEGKRLKGEWFALSADDVRAFKRWRRIL